MLFDNPIYETDGKKLPSDGGDSSKDVVSHEMETIAILRCALKTRDTILWCQNLEAHEFAI